MHSHTHRFIILPFSSSLIFANAAGRLLQQIQWSENAQNYKTIFSQKIEQFLLQLTRLDEENTVQVAKFLKTSGTIYL